MRPPKLVIRLLGRLHARVYRITGGRFVDAVGPAGILLLTTTGRRSGKPRTAPLLYVTDGDAFVVVGSQAGHDAHPGWVLNLRANPQATIQTKDQRAPVRCEELAGDERERLWQSLVAAYPGYATYRTRTARRFAVMRLCRV